VLRTAQDIFALDNAFFLIQGHPSYSCGEVGILETRQLTTSQIHYAVFRQVLLFLGHHRHDRAFSHHSQMIRSQLTWPT
jgi:hypothetical protein